MVPTSSKGFLKPDAYQMRNHVCMIPCGGLTEHSPRAWNDSQLQYYTNYILNGKPIDSMFNGFIFNGICTREDHFIYPLFVGFGKPSKKKDWQQWIDILFAVEANLHALHRLTLKEKKDVWVSIPYPHPFQRNFGDVQGKALDFQNDDDRYSAVIWWIDNFIARWEAHPNLHDKLQFRGFLWQRESLDAGDEALVKRINEAIRARDLLSMWLPNYGSQGVINWIDNGFHVVSLNSNYTGNTSYDTSWIQNTSLFSQVYHTGIQVTWGKGLIYNDTHHLDYFNLGLPVHQGYMNDSFLVYQFPNQTLETIYKEELVDYIRLYTFVKGLYQKNTYPGIPY